MLDNLLIIRLLAKARMDDKQKSAMQEEKGFNYLVGYHDAMETVLDEIVAHLKLTREV